MVKAYVDIVTLIERLHRHFLDVLRTELRNLGVEDINAVQALLLSNIGAEEVVIRDLKDRGYYQGSNVSYNIKKLTEAKYIEQERSPHDRRAVRLRLTEKGMAMCNAVQGVQQHLAETVTARPGAEADLNHAHNALSELERAWTDYIRFGGRRES